MTIDPTWLPPIAGVGVGVFLFIYWRFLEHGWAKDIERERRARAEWDASHPAE